MKNSQANINRELEVLHSTLMRFPNGASLEEIKEASGLEIELRTLQRRLEKLKDTGDILSSGKTRGTHYYPVGNDDDNEMEMNDPGVELIPVSHEGTEIQKIIRQPALLRKPVGYQPEFLLSYRPNISSYLTDAEKRKLSELGKTARLDQPAGTYAKEILQRLLIDLSWNSSRLEGNTYSLLDTQQLISKGKAADDKSAAEAQMILNHKDAIEFIVQSADEIGFNRYTIMNLHAMLSNNLLPDRNASGRLRTAGIGIGHSVFTPLSIPQKIEEFFDTLLRKAEKIKDPFEQAFFSMLQLPYLQPFDDVNKRVSRLAANIPLIKHNLAPLAFVDVPQNLYTQGILGVYELNRIALMKDVFMWAYERSSFRYAALRQSLGEPDMFRLQYRDEIRAIVGRIISQAMTPKAAGKLIREEAAFLPARDRRKFTETIDTELLSLHDGNFARYWVRPSEFARWKEVWEK